MTRSRDSEWGGELSARGADHQPGTRMAVLAEFHEGKEVVVSAGLGRGKCGLIPEASAEMSTESPGR